MLSVWDPESERRAKELLYRCLEELGATKASLYLAGSEDTFELITSYGFGKRDSIAAVVRPGDPLFDWIRRRRTTPAYLNDVHEDPALGRMLESASTARLLTLPITVNERLVGFVDARDKARRLPYTADDVAVARVIAGAFEAMVTEIGLYGPAVAADHTETLVVTTTATPALAPPSTLHRQSIEELAGLLRAFARLPGVASIAVTVTDGATVRVQCVCSLPLERAEREAIAGHQLAVFEEAGLRLPHPSRWGWAEEESGGSEKRRDEIHSALLHAGPPVWVALSVVTPAASAAAPAVLATARNHMEASVTLRNYRRAARNAARVLLEPGEQSYPHLRQHSQTVSEVAQRMAAIVHLSEQDEEVVTLAAYLHDVGMRELDYPRVYRMERPGEVERRLYQRHPVIGARIVESIAFPGDLTGAVRHHHERWDGTGYPHRLAGRAIPMASRIIHLAEVFDVLTSASSYRRPIGRRAALDTIRAESGRQFDPDLVGVLEDAVAT